MKKTKSKTMLAAFIMAFLLLLPACARDTQLSYDEIMKLPVSRPGIVETAEYSFQEWMDLIFHEHMFPGAIVRLVPEAPTHYVVVSPKANSDGKEIAGKTVTPIRILEVYERMNDASLSGGGSYEVGEDYYLLPAAKETPSGTDYGAYERFFAYHDQDCLMDEEKGICVFPEDGEYSLPPASYMSDYVRCGYGDPLEPGKEYYAMVCFIEGKLEIACTVPTAGVDGDKATLSYWESVGKDLYDYVKEKQAASAE